MDRVYQANAIETPPSVTASSGSYPTAGNKASSQLATVPGPYWFYSITEEIRNAIVAEGLRPDPSQVNKLAAAMAKYLPVSGGAVTGNVTVQGKNVVRSVNGTSADASGNVTISGLVKSVNGTNADASGNVTISVSDGTVTQKYYNAKFTVVYSGTLTVSSLTAYKPVYILVKALTSSGGTCYWPEVINGAVLNSDVKDSTLTKGALYSLCVIPTGTAITMRFASNSQSSDKYADYAVSVHQ